MSKIFRLVFLCASMVAFAGSAFARGPASSGRRVDLRGCPARGISVRLSVECNGTALQLRGRD
jgi:hypothetical protein